MRTLIDGYAKQLQARFKTTPVRRLRTPSDSSQIPSTCSSLPLVFGCSNMVVKLPWCVKSIPNPCLTPRIVFPSCRRPFTKRAVGWVDEDLPIIYEFRRISLFTDPTNISTKLELTEGPSSPKPFHVLICASIALLTLVDQSRVTLSLQQERLRAACQPHLSIMEPRIE